jgi:hypothetical protein
MILKTLAQQKLNDAEDTSTTTAWHSGNDLEQYSGGAWFESRLKHRPSPCLSPFSSVSPCKCVLCQIRHQSSYPSLCGLRYVNFATSSTTKPSLAGWSWFDSWRGHSAQAGLGTHQPSYPVGTAGFFLCGKATGV